MHYSAFKGNIMLTHFVMREWPSGKVLVIVSKFNAYVPHITGCFLIMVIKVTFADKACPLIFRFDRSRNAPTTSTRRL